VETEVAIIIAAVGAAVTAVLSSKGILALVRVGADYFRAKAERNAEAEAVRVLLSSKIDSLIAEVHRLREELSNVRENFAGFYAHTPTHCPSCNARIVDRDATPVFGVKRNV